MTPYRQVILPGDVGSDVLAVKRGMQKMGVAGSGGLIVSGTGRLRNGATAVELLKKVQRQHGLRVDGKYGSATHAIIAPHFDAWGVVLYKRAAIRKRTPPAPPIGFATAQDAAKRLLAEHRAGHYRADNGGDLYDLERTAEGQPVWSHGGYWVHLDHRPIEVVLWLIQQGYKVVGTFALCSDHHYDGPHGHSGGLAVDVSSLAGTGISSGGMHDRTLSAARAIRDHAPMPLRPWQLIAGGSGYVFYSDIEATCIPSPGFYGWSTLAGHRNHIHIGYYTTRRADRIQVGRERADIDPRRPVEKSLLRHLLGFGAGE